MNRWWGNSADAERQAGERSSRAARRTISSLPVVQSDSEEDYLDCDTSGIFGGLDSNDDTAIDNMACAQQSLPHYLAILSLVGVEGVGTIADNQGPVVGML